MDVAANNVTRLTKEIAKLNNDIREGKLAVVKQDTKLATTANVVQKFVNGLDPRRDKVNEDEKHLNETLNAKEITSIMKRNPKEVQNPAVMEEAIKELERGIIRLNVDINE